MWAPNADKTDAIHAFQQLDAAEKAKCGYWTVALPCRIGDPVWIIANRGGVDFVRPARVVRIEIDADLKPVIYTKGGFGLWGKKVFPDKPSAESELEWRKHHG